MKPLRNRWLKSLFYAAAVSALALFGLDWWFNPSHPTLDAKRVASVEIQLFNIKYTSPKAGQAESTTVVTDEQVIRKLLGIFAEAGRGSEHKGVTSGRFIVHLKDGGREELGILPGFRDDRYEYRYFGRINYIDRAQFLATLESVGILSITQISQMSK